MGVAIFVLEMSDVSGERFAAALAFSLEKLGISHVSLKEEQRLAVKAIYDGKDVFVWLPTGFGKSLCYQTLPFVMDYKLGCKDNHSAVLVVSPLVALMIDQVQSLRRRGVKCSIVTSTRAVAKEYLATDSNLNTDSLLFCAPEALVKPNWRDALENTTLSGRIVCVVVDEAHCVSKW